MTSRWVALVLILVLALLGGCSAKEGTLLDEKQSAADINAQLGVRYMQQGNLEVALEKLKRALAQDPRHVAANHYIAELYRQMGALDLAEKHFKKALSLVPHDPALQNNYGVFLCDQGRFTLAEERFMAATRSPGYKRHDEAYENAAVCALRIPDIEKAEMYFRKALELNPLLPNSLYQMAKLSYDKRQYLRGRAFIQRYGVAARHTAESLRLAADIEAKLGDTEAEQGYRERLQREFPNSDQTVELLEQDQ